MKKPVKPVERNTKKRKKKMTYVIFLNLPERFPKPHKNWFLRGSRQPMLGRITSYERLIR